MKTNRQFIMGCGKKLTLFMLLPIAYCLLPIAVSSQQVEEFSLLRENAFVLNPALAGMEGWIHGQATFRKQFTKIDQSPYTAMLAMNGAIGTTHVGIGGYLIHDVTGPTGKSSATISVAYNIPLFRHFSARFSSGRSNHNLSIGLSLSVVQYRMRGDQLITNDAGDPGLYTTRGSKIFPDASFGIYYRYKNNFYAGVSAPQIMGLNINYRANDGTAKIKKVQHLNVLIGGKIEMARGNFSIDPVAAFRWVKGAPPQGDAGLRAYFYKIVWLGANYRSTQYAILEAGVGWKEVFTVSYSYDMNLAKYRRDIGPTHEVSLGFKVNKERNLVQRRSKKSL